MACARPRERNRSCKSRQVITRALSLWPAARQLCAPHMNAQLRQRGTDAAERDLEMQLSTDIRYFQFAPALTSTCLLTLGAPHACIMLQLS